MTFLVAFPGVALCMLNVYLGLPPGGEHEQAPFVQYDHLRMRTKVITTIPLFETLDRNNTGCGVNQLTDHTESKPELTLLDTNSIVTLIPLLN